MIILSIFFCNVTWMDYYCGPEEQVFAGGSYVEKNNRGAEEYNFADLNGLYYGYVATQGHKIKIERLGAGKNDEYIDNVLVVWVARHPARTGVKIVGWYKNARVYREFHYNCFNEIYNIETEVNNGVLLPIKERKIDVPRASIVGTGKGMGQSNYWYADNYIEAKKYVNEVRSYINNYDGKQINNKKSCTQILQDKGFSRGDIVELVDGFHYKDLDNIDFKGWKGEITNVFYAEEKKVCVSLKYTKETIEKFSENYIKYKNKLKVNPATEITLLDDIKKIS